MHIGNINFSEISINRRASYGAMATICPYCTQKTELIWTNGCGLCEHCKVNIEEVLREEMNS